MSALSTEPSRLALASGHRREIERQAATLAPEECCGILIGVPAGDGWVVHEVVAASNVSEEDRQRRYVIDPAALLATHRHARQTGRAVVGYYHSHPGRPAVPSERDRRFAWPGVCYLIAGGAPPEIALRAWQLSATGQAFDEIAIETAAPAEGDRP